MAKSAAAAAVKGGTKKSTAAKSDLLAQIATKVETLTTPKAAFSMVEEIAGRTGQDNFELGGVLAVIHDKGSVEGGEAWLDGHASFRDLLEKRFGLDYRKAMVLIQNYKYLVEKQIPWSAVKDIGWTKLWVLGPILTAKNVDGWVEKAKKHTVEQLKEMVAKAKNKTGADASEGGESTVSRMTFTLHKDQKRSVKAMLEKGKKEFKTEYDNVVLHNVAQMFTTGAIEAPETPELSAAGVVTWLKSLKKKEALESLAEIVAAVGAEQTFEAVDKALPDWYIAVKAPEAQAEEQEEAKKLGFKYDPATFDLDKMQAEAKSAKKGK